MKVHCYLLFQFFFNATATTEIYTYCHTLSLHDALPISLRNAGAILLHSVPATIITSDWRGDARGAAPKRSMSYRGMLTWIISTAQQARPKVIHHSDPVRAHWNSSSVDVTRKPLSLTSLFSASKKCWSGCFPAGRKEPGAGRPSSPPNRVQIGRASGR